eukprot:8319614-Pyramimonas_sp.AAC.1
MFFERNIMCLKRRRYYHTWKGRPLARQPLRECALDGVSLPRGSRRLPPAHCPVDCANRRQRLLR